MTDLDEDNEDLDDDGSEDVQHYPLPEGLLKAAVELLGEDEVAKILGGGEGEGEGDEP